MYIINMRVLKFCVTKYVNAYLEEQLKILGWIQGRSITIAPLDEVCLDSVQYVNGEKHGYSVRVMDTHLKRLILWTNGRRNINCYKNDFDTLVLIVNDIIIQYANVPRATISRDCFDAIDVRKQFKSVIIYSKYKKIKRHDTHSSSCVECRERFGNVAECICSKEDIHDNTPFKKIIRFDNNVLKYVCNMFCNKMHGTCRIYDVINVEQYDPMKEFNGHDAKKKISLRAVSF